MNDEMSRVLAVLKENTGGMTVTDVSKSMKMNRNSVAKYLEMLVISGRVDMNVFGPSKFYRISQRVPMATILSVTSDCAVTLDKNFSILSANNRFLELVGRKYEDVVGNNIVTSAIPVLSHPDFITEIREVLQGKEMTKEICIQKPPGEHYFYAKLIPAVLEDGGQGLMIILEDITVRKRAERALKEAKEELERRYERRTADLRLANEALQSEINNRRRHEELSEALNNINMTINSTLDFDEVMNRVVTVSASTLKCETLIIALRENGHWVARYTFGIPVDIRGTMQPDEYVPAFEYEKGSWSPVAMEDARNDPRSNHQVVEQFGIFSTLVIPLAHKTEVIGAMFLNYHSGPANFSSTEIDFARKLGASVSLALDNARAFQKMVRMERKLKETVEWYVDALEKAPILAQMIDTCGNIMYFNDHLLKLTGLENAGVTGRDWFDSFLEPDLKEELRQEFNRAIASDDIGGYSRTETRIKCAGDRRTNIQWYNALVHCEDGKIIGMASVGSELRS